MRVITFHPARASARLWIATRASAFPAVRRVSTVSISAVAVMLGLLCISPAHGAPPLPMLLAALPVSAGMDANMVASAADRMVMRARRVDVQFRHIDPRSDEVATALIVDLFDGRAVIVDRSDTEDRGPGNYAWRGKVRGRGQSDAIVTVVNGQIAGSIVVADDATRTLETYQILSAAGGGQALRQLDPARFPPDHPPGVRNAGFVTHPVAPDAQTSGGIAADVETLATVDLLVLYSNQTAAAAKATIGVEIQHAIDRTNLAYANSGIAARLRLVHYAQLSYDESEDMVFDLDQLTSGNDDILLDARLLRDAYGADLVSLFVERSDYCGVGWIGADAGRGFTVVSRVCASANMSLAHEIGHNFGARHDLEADPASAPFAYGHGYVYRPGGWRTVMAYNNAAADTARIPYFSNPALSVGTPPVAMGTASTSDVARVHNERARAMAGFRQPMPTAAPSSCVATATPSTLMQAGGAVEVVGRCGDGGVPTRWSWTRNGSPLDASGETLRDTLPANAGPMALIHTYAGIPCNGSSCAPTVAARVTVAAFPLISNSGVAVAASEEATLFAEVTSNGASTTVGFDYGLTSGYGSSVAAQPNPVPADASEAYVSARISGLACGTAYHFAIVATSIAGTTRTHDSTFTTGVCATANARLSNLALSTGPLSPPFAGLLAPPFASGVASYSSLMVDTPVVVIPTAAESAATIAVNGMRVASGERSAPINLRPGNNPITVLVTAPDGVTTRTYTINVVFFYSDVGPRAVIEYYNAGLDHYFITWVPEEIAALDAGLVVKGWVRTGHSLQSRLVAQEGTSPVCRYYIPPPLGDSHFFGRDASECKAAGGSNPGFVLEDPAFMHMVLPTAGTCPVETTPVYRFFSNRPDANHRYTTDRAVRAEMMARGWLAEGDGPENVVMCAPR